MSAILRQHWQGVPSEDIGASMAPQRTAKDVNDAVEKQRAALEDNALDRIIQQAEQGEVAAVEWLERRGFIGMPWKRTELPVFTRPRIS